MALIVELASSGSSDRCGSKHVSRQPDPSTDGHQSHGEQKNDQRRQQGGSKKGQYASAWNCILLTSAA